MQGSSVQGLAVRPLEASLIPSAAALLARAFFDNPAHVYICRDRDGRLRQLQRILGGNLRAQPDLGSSFCLVQDADVVAMGFWTCSAWPAPGIVRQLRAGLLEAPLLLGTRGFRRLLEVSNSVDHHRDEAVGDVPFWYLNNMAVHEDLRGQGIGSELLRIEMSRQTERDPGSVLVLATQKPENVSFYRGLGFELRSEATLGRGEASFRNWIMATPPPGTRAW